MDEQSNLTFTDEEFEKMLRDGLNSFFKDDEISVSDDLIARTMKAIEDIKLEAETPDNEAGAGEQESEAKVASIDSARRRKLYRFYKIAGAVAAVALLGVVGVSVLRNGTNMMKSAAPTANMAIMADRADDCATEATAEAVSDSMDMDVADSGTAAPMLSNGFTEEKSKYAETADDCLDGYYVEEDDQSEPIIWYVGDVEVDFYPLSNAYYITGDNGEELFNNIYDTAFVECGEAVYDTVGFTTEDIIPEDIGFAVMTVDYMSADCRKSVTIKVYEYYCEINDAVPVSSSLQDYTAALYKVDDGYGLADRLMTMLAPTE